MEYKHRLIENRILELFNQYPVVAVLGAKQAGKSTLVENVFPQAGTFGFDPMLDVGNIRRDPKYFRRNSNIPAFFDDVQHVPRLLSSIMEQVDYENEKGIYILSGFQDQAVLERIKNLMPGRVGVAHLWSMSRREITGDETPGFLDNWLSGAEFEFSAWADKEPEPCLSRIWHGGYPKIMELPDPLVPAYWQSYLHGYVERDVRENYRVSAVQKFNEFILKLAGLTAQEPNFNKMSREIGVDRKSVLRWFEIAKATYQWISLPPFARNPTKRVIGREKGFFTDTGFLCYLHKIATPEMIGRHPLFQQLFTTYVVLEIIKNLQKLPIEWKLHHFRAYSGSELDLVVETKNGLYPMTIRAQSKFSRRDLRSFAAFGECFPDEKIHSGLVITTADKPKHLSDSVVSIPWWYI